VNWTKNKNEVVSLEDGIRDFAIGRFQGGYPQMRKWENPTGYYMVGLYVILMDRELVDPADGQFIKTSTQINSSETDQPDWLMGDIQ